MGHEKVARYQSVAWFLEHRRDKDRARCLDGLIGRTDPHAGFVRIGQVEQFAATGEALFALAVDEKTIVSNSTKPFWRYVGEEPANKLFRR